MDTSLPAKVALAAWLLRVCVSLCVYVCVCGGGYLCGKIMAVGTSSSTSTPPSAAPIQKMIWHPFSRVGR